MADVTLTKEQIELIIKAIEKCHEVDVNIAKVIKPEALIAIGRLALKSFEPNPARALVEKMRDALNELKDSDLIYPCSVDTCKNSECVAKKKAQEALTAADAWLANHKGEVK